MRVVVIGLAVVVLLTAACSGSSPDTDPVAQSAVTDLADRLGLDESTITVVSVEDVTWSDGSLGCPESGMMYTQALVDGKLIVLEVVGAEYEYHSGPDAVPLYCESPVAPASQD